MKKHDKETRWTPSFQSEMQFSQREYPIDRSATRTYFEVQVNRQVWLANALLAAMFTVLKIEWLGVLALILV